MGIITKENKITIDREFNPSVLHPYYFIRKGLYNKIQEYAGCLKGNLLDFGCGAKPYKHFFLHTTSYIGVDLDNSGHNHHTEQIDFFYDGKTLPFENARFDSIFSSEVFEHIFNIEEILPELNRVLKPGGKVLLTCPFVWPEHESPHDYARYTVFALKDLLQKAGFQTEVIDKSGDFFLTVFQLRVAYINDVLLPKLTFPFLIKVFRSIIIPLSNVAGIFFSKILPGNKTLYLSNIIVAQKVK